MKFKYRNREGRPARPGNAEQEGVDMAREIAKRQGEWKTEAIYERDGTYYMGAHNGGGTGAYEGPVEAFVVVSESDVVARLLDWGYDITEIDELLAEGMRGREGRGMSGERESWAQLESRSNRESWVDWLEGFGAGALWDSIIRNCQGAESQCVYCERTIRFDIVETGGVPDWHDEGDYGCAASPETGEEGTGRHLPVGVDS